MAIAHTDLHVRRVLMQLETLLINMQRDMLANANQWLAWANAQSKPAADIITGTKAAAASYEKLLGYVVNYKNTSPNWTALVTMYQVLGGSSTDAVNLYTELKAVADGLTNATLSTYPDIINASNQIISAVSAPDSLWPE